MPPVLRPEWPVDLVGVDYLLVATSRRPFPCHASLLLIVLFLIVQVYGVALDGVVYASPEIVFVLACSCSSVSVSALPSALLSAQEYPGPIGPGSPLRSCFWKRHTKPF